jgi:hypothetical protein
MQLRHTDGEPAPPLSEAVPAGQASHALDAAAAAVAEK